VAASGSVGDTIAPSANAAAQGSPPTSVCATTATAQMVTSTSPTASSVIGRALAHRSRGEEKNAAWYSSGGQEQHQDQLGRQLGRRHTGHEPEHQAAQDEQDRVGHPDRASQHAQSAHGHHEHQQQQLRLMHAITSPAPGVDEQHPSDAFDAHPRPRLGRRLQCQQCFGPYTMCPAQAKFRTAMIWCGGRGWGLTRLSLGLVPGI
jgi:hypothetical protein